MQKPLPVLSATIPSVSVWGNIIDKARKTSSLLALVSMLLLVFGACSQENVVQSNEAKLPRGYLEKYHAGLRYGLFIPPSYDSTQSYPLIVSLHGSGDTVSWDLSWYHDAIQSTDPCFVLTPKSLVTSTGWGTSWMRDHSADMRKALEVVDSLAQTFNLNANRLYLYGVSMGGFGVFSVLAKEPGMFAAAFAVCGGGDPTTARLVAQTPLWIFHGSDDRIVPVDYSRNMYKAILSADGKHVRYTEYPGIDHAAWIPAWREPTLTAWLLAQEQSVTHGKPDTVENLACVILNGSQIKLAWHAPTIVAGSNNQIWYCKIFRDFDLIADLDNTHSTFIDSGVAGASTYSYNMSAVNYFFEESRRTTPITIKTPLPTP